MGPCKCRRGALSAAVFSYPFEIYTAWHFVYVISSSSYAVMYISKRVIDEDFDGIHAELRRHSGGIETALRRNSGGTETKITFFDSSFISFHSG